MRARLPWQRMKLGLLAGAACVGAILPFTYPHPDWQWLYVWQLDSRHDGSLANWVSVGLWALVAVLAARCRFRWWWSVSLLAAVIAVNEVNDFRLLLTHGTPFERIHGRNGWRVMVAPVAVPLLLVAGASLWRATASDRMRRLLFLAAVIFGGGALIRDTLEPLNPRDRVEWIWRLENASELMAAATLVLLLLVMHWNVRLYLPHARWLGAVAMGVPLLAGGLAGVAEWEMRDTGWHVNSSAFLAGPVRIAEQAITVDHDWLSRIDVRMSSRDEPADAWFRLTPVDAPTPIREARQTVMPRSKDPGWARFAFTPIPDSGGRRYTVSVGPLGSEPSHIEVGLSRTDADSSVRLNGVAPAYVNHLTLHTYWAGRGPSVIAAHVHADIRHARLPLDIITSMTLWCLMALVVIVGSGPQRKYRRNSE